MSRSKNPKYESMSLEELKANMEKSRKQLEYAIHNKNILEQRKKLVERKERSHRLIVKGAEFEKVFPLSKDFKIVWSQRFRGCHTMQTVVACQRPHLLYQFAG